MNTPSDRSPTDCALTELRDLVAALGTRLATQEAANAELRANIAAPRAAARPPRRAGRRLASFCAALLLALVPLGLLAANPFFDLTGGVHDANIDAIYNAGITTGCVPNQAYCPTANVTREEMASFLARTAGLGTNPPVVNAKTAQTAANAQKAENADMLDGISSQGFLASTGEVVYRYSFYGIVAEDPNNVGFGYRAGPEVVVSPKVAGTINVLLALDAPTRLFNRGLAVRQLTICYEKNGAMKITGTGLRAGDIGQGTTILLDGTDRASEDPDCYSLSPATTQLTGGPLYLRLNLNLPQNALSGDIRLYSVRLTLVPTALP